jgi:hypothetical protein
MQFRLVPNTPDELDAATLDAGTAELRIGVLRHDTSHACVRAMAAEAPEVRGSKFGYV